MMSKDKTKEEFLTELETLRHRVAELETAEIQRMQAEENLRKSEEKYRLISESVPVLVYSALPDKRSTNLFVSGRSKELTGYSAEEFLKNPDLWSTIVHPEDSAFAWEQIEKHRRNKTMLDVEYRIITRNGTTKWIRDKATPALDEQGEIIRIDGFMEDVTARKQAERALRKSEREKALILNSTTELITFQDTELNILWANRAAAESVDVDIDAIVGEKCFERWHSAKRPCRDCPVLRSMETGNPEEGEIVTPDGRTWLIRGNPVTDNAGDIVGAVEVTLEITQRKEAEEALKKSEERYRQLFEKNLTGVALHEVIVDKKGKPVDYIFLEVNDAFEEQTGLQAGEVTGKRITEVLPDVRREMIERYGKIALEGGSLRFETFSKPLDKHLEISVFSIWPGQFATVLKDITDKVKHVENMEFLALAATRLNDMSRADELYQFVAGSIRERVANAVVVVAVKDASSDVHRVELVAGLGPRTSSLLKHIGRDPVGMTFPLHEEYRDALNDGKIMQIPAGISELTHGRIPQPVGRAIEKLLHIGDMYTVDLMKGDDLFGNVTIILKKGDTIKDKTILETFIRQASIAFQRIITQNELQESERKYRTVFENTGAATCIVEDDTTISLVNTQFAEVSGYAQEDIEEKMSWTEFVVADDLEKMKRYHVDRRKNAEAAPKQYEFRFVDKQGNIKNVLLTIDMIEGTKKSVASLIDITAWKKAEEKYRGVVENAHDAIYIIHPEKGFQYVNPAFEELTGYTAVEMYGEEFSFWDIIHPDDVDMIRERGLARSRHEEVPERYEFRVIASDGAVKTVEATTVDMAEQETLIMGIIRDNTQRKQAEKERERAMEEMHRALALEKRFKADAAHFFLNPIAICKGYMEIALAEMGDTPGEKIRKAKRAIQRIEAVIENVVTKGEIHE
jgi:PAS domain S-box-containing protein